MNKILQANNIYKSFRKKDKNELYVLENIDFSLRENEIVALLGKSGSGKSTLLRILAGLIPATKGEVKYYDKTITKPIKGISMVFQNFALLPWLNVLQNVELGLEAQGVAEDERRKRALHAIDTIGMDGFESAFPKELSGGMCQRVGFARALVMEPELLILDEPFSALDVLTAESLKNDLMNLWHKKKTNIKGMILVTHNIEEAAMMADRILIFGHNPGHIKADFRVDIPYPRTTHSSPIQQVVDRVYTLMTSESSNKGALKTRILSLSYRLPSVSPEEISGLMDTMNAEFENKTIDLPELADSIMMNMDELFSLTETLEIIGFATISQGDIKLTQIGEQFTSADILEKKKIFANSLMENLPLISYIKRVLEERHNHTVSEERFLSKIEDYLSEKEAERVLRTAIDWGRYAELFAYDYNTGMLSLENPD